MANEEAKLFVAGLPDSMSEEVLKQLFESTGGVVLNVSFPKDHATGRRRGYAFVTLSTPEQAAAARDQLNGSLQGGRSIAVRPYQAEPPKRGEGGGGFDRGPRPGGAGGPRPSDDDRKLYVGNLPYECSQQDIEEVVNKAAGSAGTVVHVSLPTGPDGRKKGFGFVTLSSADAAKAAVTGLQNVMMAGRPLKVNMAQPKGDRPPRTDGFGGGGYGGGGGGGFREFGGGPPMGGGAFGGPPPPTRKTFDDRRRKGAGKGGPGGGEDGPRKKRFDNDRGGGGGGGAGGRNWGGGDDDE
jgi:RNA recognition motif-containing protein